MGLTGCHQAVALLLPLLRHRSEFVREAALLGLAEAGGREIARPAMPALKDESGAVRAAAVGAGEIGRAWCRGREEMSGGGGSLKKKKKKKCKCTGGSSCTSTH